MGLYFQFAATLTFGLLGLSVVLTLLIDKVLSDWDYESDLRRLRERLHRALYGRREQWWEEMERTHSVSLRARMAEPAFRPGGPKTPVA
ncbi:MAG: hypothetical protein HY549_12310 [Elusimicrobia bacterium]|nr:hypothetical protein [Elusimicrobiota bacterium]